MLPENKRDFRAAIESNFHAVQKTGAGIKSFIYKLLTHTHTHNCYIDFNIC